MDVLEACGPSRVRDDRAVGRPKSAQTQLRSFNTVSEWVASTILWQEKHVDRVKAIVQFIEIAQVTFKFFRNFSYNAQALDKLNNFNALLEVLSGISHTAVWRLRATLADIPKKYQTILTNLRRKMDPTQNFRKLHKEVLPTCQPPAIPYL